MLMHDRIAKTIEKFELGLQACHRPEDRTLVQKYIAELAPVLAHNVLGKDVRQELQDVDRLFGHTWLHDIRPFEDAFAEWWQFRREYAEFSLRAMTVNERLVAVSKMEQFDQACAAKDRQTARRLLESVHLSDSDIERILSDRM